MAPQDGSETFGLIRDEIRRRNGALRLEHAAQMLLLSRSWFRHEFKRCVGISYRTACVQAKVAHGRDLLANTCLTIPEISLALGYSDRTKFEKSFKRVYGVSPTAFRSSLRSSPERWAG